LAEAIDEAGNTNRKGRLTTVYLLLKVNIMFSIFSGLVLIVVYGDYQLLKLVIFGEYKAGTLTDGEDLVQFTSSLK